jgi:hypothetical protein
MTKGEKNKLIDIGFHRYSLDIGNDFWTVEIKDSGRDTRLLSPSINLASKVHVDNYVDKSRIALFYLCGIYHHTSNNHILTEYQIHIHLVNLPFKLF